LTNIRGRCTIKNMKVSRALFLKGARLVILGAFSAGMFFPRFIFAEEMDSASTFLYEYGTKLYREGNVYDAIHQLKNALMVNPRNTAARDYLNKIFQEQDAQGRQIYFDINKDNIRQLNTKITQLEQEKKTYQEQLNSLKASEQGKDGQLQKMTQDLEAQKGVLQQKGQSLSVSLQEKERTISDLNRQIAQLEQEIRLSQGQVGSLQKDSSQKESRLQKLNQEIESRKRELAQESERLRGSLKSNETRIEQLKRQFAQLKEEGRTYEQQVNILQYSASTKDRELEKLREDFESSREKYVQELSQREQDLGSLKASYETKLNAINEELRIKDSKIKSLDDTTRAILENNRRIKIDQIAKIDKILRDIEEILPELKKKTKGKGALSREEAEIQRSQIARIEMIMRKIEEVLPKEEEPLVSDSSRLP